MRDRQFKALVTRDRTESAEVTVYARDQARGGRQALSLADDPPKGVVIDWQPNVHHGRAYYGDPTEDVVEVPQAMRYEHDWDSSILVGQFSQFDLYYCPPSDDENEKIVARSGDEAHEYVSGNRRMDHPGIKAGWMLADLMSVTIKVKK